MNENPLSKYRLGRQIDVVQKFTRIQSFGQNLMVSQWNSSGISSQDSPHCSSATMSKSSKVLSRYERNSQKNFSLDGLSSCRCSTTSHGDLNNNEKECELSAQLVSLYAKIFSPGQWSFLGPGSEKKWYSTNEYSPQGEWDRIAEQMMLTFAESKHQYSDPRVHYPEECSKANVVENCQYSSVSMGDG